MGRKRRISVVVLLVILSLFVSTLNVFAEEGEVSILPPGLDEFDIRILNNGTYVDTNTKPIEKENGLILTPARIVLESAGYEVKWNETGIIDIVKGNENYKLNLNEVEYEFENLNGTVMIDHKYFKEIKGIKLTYDPLTRTLVLKSEFKEDDIYDYDLGKRTMRTSLDKDLNYVLNGGMVVPKSDKNPLVIILHGAHGGTIAEENRFDLGYSYLLRELKKEGYVTVAPNVTIQYSYEDDDPVGNERILNVFEETIKSLVEANGGSNVFGIDLKDKIDFENVILVGHSRSGYEIFEINNKYKDDKRFNIKGLLALAPARMGKAKFDEVDNPVSIVLPELDGDVSFLDGQSIFDELIDNEKRKSDAQLVYLYGANHNAFNEGLLIQDKGNLWYEGGSYEMTQEEQKDFLIKYSKEYIKSVLKGDFISEKLEAKDDKILGYKALVSSYSKGLDVYKAENGLKNIEAKDVKISDEVASIDADINTVGLFNHPGNSEKLDLLNVKWEKENGEVKFKVSESTSGRNKLSIYLAQDSTDALNKKENQAFTVVLKDSNGKSASIKLDKNTQVLKYVDGTVEFDGKMYSNHTPMGILDIDLDEFKDIDRDNIKEVGLKFDQTKTGSIFIRFISFK